MQRKNPPNQYNRRFAELSKNPLIGFPTTEIKYRIQDSLIELRLQKGKKDQRISKVVSGENANNPWISIGPSNVGGRTRAAIFDLNDSEYKKVIAGGVSGGLWINENLTSENSEWTPIESVPGNLAVSSIIQSQSNPNIIFVGTGESYTNDDAKGNGIYRSIDGGSSWEKVFGRNFLNTTVSRNDEYRYTDIDGDFFVNDMAIWSDNAGNEYVLSILGDSYAYNGIAEYYDFFSKGLYISSNYGETWTKVNLPGDDDPFTQNTLNDIEIDAVNRIWISTTSGFNGTTGGPFYTSPNLDTFSRINPTFPEIDQENIRRIEFASSKTTSGLFYVLLHNLENGAEIYRTTDSFETLVKLNEPIDLDTDIPETDFTRGQADYDLEIEIDPNNDGVIYVGGINLHRSNDGGQNWDQLSLWYPNWEHEISYVHADQHGVVFQPDDSDKGIILNDGGVFYTESFESSNNEKNIYERVEGYVTTQFYDATQSPLDYPEDIVLGGTQDNGTLLSNNPIFAINSFNKIQGGDGGFSYFDQIDSKYLISNYIYNNTIRRTDLNSGNISYILSSEENEGDFINPGALDSNLDILFTNGSKEGDFRIRRFYDLSADKENYESNYINNLSSNPTVLKISPFTSSSSTLFVGFESGQINKYTNANSEGLSSITLFESLGSVSDISFGDTEEEIYVTYYNYGINNIFFSYDWGENWFPKDGNLPDIPVTSIQYNPFQQGEVIIGTELGIWRSLNFNEDEPEWEQVNNGMLDVRVTDIEFRGDSLENNRLLVSTYGKGLFIGSFNGIDRCNTVSNLSGDWIITGNDSYGDGWNGARIEVLSEGIVIGEFTLEESEGYGPKTKSFNFSDQYENLSFRFIPGDWDEEISFEIFSPADFKIISKNESDSKPWGLLNLAGCDDLDSDGISDFKDQCPNTPEGVIINTDGCEVFSLPEDVFSVKVASSTCIDSDNGSINLFTSDSSFNYLYSVDGSDPLPFQNDVTISGLETGSYQVCFTVEGVSNYNRCYTVNVVEPDALEASSMVDMDNRTISLNLSGSKSYSILLNGKSISTDNSIISLPLQSGKNTIEVKGDQECQGLYFEEIFVSEEVKVYPNPTNGPLQLYISGMDNQVTVDVTSINGTVVMSSIQSVPMNRVIELNLSDLNPGIYIVSVKGATVQVHQKVIRK